MNKMKMLATVMVMFALTAGSALATVPIFAFDNATGELTIDTNGLTIESFSIAGPGTDGHTGLPNQSTAYPLHTGAPPGVNSPFNEMAGSGGGAGGAFPMNWFTNYFDSEMQSYDDFSFGVNSTPSGVMLYATYVGSVQFSDFPEPETAVSYFSTEEGLATAPLTLVPEPATLGMLAVGGLALLRRKK